MPLVLRSVKNDELEWSEVDGNFLYLENKIDDLEQLVNGDEVVKVTPQTFSTAQQNQALSNIGAVSAEQFTDLEDRVEEVESNAYVSYSLQSPSVQEQENLRTNADVYSKTEVDDAVLTTTKNVTISEGGQTVVPDANQNVIRFASLVTGTTIQPGIKNGDQLVIINKSTAETAFDINIPVVLQTAVNSGVFSVQPNTNYLFWFDLSLSRWIDVSF